MYGPSEKEWIIFFAIFAVIFMVVGVLGFLGLSYLYHHVDILIK